MADNRLAQSASAYLRSAAHQPIGWYEFGEAAFARARELDRLILLDIGAVWCHWCHVIDRESYEDPEIAALINANFVPVKVDRDQRPDIDARYQQAVASLTGQGGWPLTGFLTCDGRVLYGGTYFPPQAMKKLLAQMADAYREQRQDIMRNTLDAITPEMRLEQETQAEADALGYDIPQDVFERVLASARKTYDTTHGGWGLRPKFPHFSTLAFLLCYATLQGGQPEIDGMIQQTLLEMACGGVYDQIGGGFHRYSVDAEWHVPHFEKMVYDNAEALSVYAYACRRYGDSLYREAADGILAFTRTVLSDSLQGGFYASQDADINLDDDGDYFTWTLDEVRAILPAPAAEAVIAFYDMTANGDMHERPGRNVLRRRENLEANATRLERPVETLQSQLTDARQAMLAHRMTRPTPFVDTTLYLNWNGMMLVGYFDAADLLDLPDSRAFAVKTLELLLTTHVDTTQGLLLHCVGVPATLEDYAWFAYALLKGYQSTGEVRYLDTARHWFGVACALFEDSHFGGFYDVPMPDASTLALLKFRRKPTEDSPSSSANGIMLRIALILATLTDDAILHDKAEHGLRIFAEALAQRGLYSMALVTTLYQAWHPPAKLVVQGTDEALANAARRAMYPGKIIAYEPEAAASASAILVCEGTRCLPPVTSAGALQAVLDSLRPQPAAIS